MKPEQFQRIKSLYPHLSRLPPAERSGFLAAACGDDAELQRILEEMLTGEADFGDEEEAAHSRSGFDSLWEELGQSADEIKETQEALPDYVDAFRIVRKIGEGGMGIVYEAQENHPRRTVALKLLRGVFADSNRMRRFQQEIDLLGALEHPGIARIYMAGTATIGATKQPYFAMELVRGCPLGQYIEQHQLPTRHKLELFARLCDAVEYAHAHGIVHRDLKPANVLVDESVHGGQPKVLDFGVARALASPDHTRTTRTETEQLVGTLQYMSPEQTMGDASSTNARSDVYALGVMLYELLTGSLPHDLRGCSVPEAIRRICLTEPHRIRVHGRELADDRETIVAKALEKEVARRYPSACALATDIRHYLNHEPIKARPASRAYRVRKFARRNRAWIAGVSVTLVVFLLGAFGTARYARQARDQARLGAQSEHSARWAKYKAALIATEQALDRDDLATAERSLENAPAEHRAWEWHYLKRRLLQCDAHLTAPSPPAGGFCLDEDQGEVLALLQDGSVGIWKIGTWEWIGTRAFRVGQFHSMSSNCARGLVGLGNAEGGVVLWNRRTDTLSTLLENDNPPLKFIALTRDGSRVVVRRAGEILLVDSRSAEVVARTTTVGSAVAMTSDASAVLIAMDSELQVQVWDPLKNEIRILHRMPEEPVSLAISNDDRRVAVGTRFRGVYILDLVTGALVSSLIGHQDFVFSVGFSSDGRRLVTTSLDNTIRFWDLENGRQVKMIHNVGGPTKAAMVAGGETLLASLGAIRVCPSTSEASKVLRGHSAYVYSVACSPNGLRLAAGMGGWGGEDKAVVWRMDAPIPYVEHELRGASANGLVFSRDSALLCVGSDVYDLSDPGHVVAETDLAKSGGPPCEGFGPRIAKQLRLSSDGMVRAIVDSRTRVFNPGQKRGSIEIQSTETGKHMATLSIETPATSAAFGPDRPHLVTAHEDGTVRIWNIAHLPRVTPVAVLQGHSGIVYCVEYSPDGRRIVSGGNDNKIYIWDAATGEALLVLYGHVSYVHDLVFGPDGQRLFSASGDKTVRIWDASQ